MNHGHFGRPATVAAIAIGAALLAHLILPFGVVEFRGPAAPDAELFRFFEASQAYQDAPDVLAPAGWSLGLLLTGMAIAGLGAAILVVMGHQPLQVDAARWIGASGGLLVVAGASVMAVPAFYHVGTGFATFMGSITFTEFRAQFWAISPVIAAAASLVAAHQGLHIMTKVCANRDGIRDTATGHADAARAGLALLALVLFVPWSIGMLPDGLNDGLQTNVEDTGRAPLFFSAQDIQGATLAELTPAGPLRYGSEEDWRLTKIALDVMMAAALVTVAIGTLGAFIGTARSVGGPSGLESTLRVLFLPMVLLWAAATIVYAMSWFTAKPRPDAGLFLPGFWPVLVPIAAWFAGRQQLRLGRNDSVASA